MMGPHTHIWAPWSPYFTVVGSWNYWHGPYDPFFWTYWPYYSLYYRSYYPSYYGAGRFYRGGGWRVAPAIHPVQVQAWRGSRLRGAPVYQVRRAGRRCAGGAGSVQVRTAGVAPGGRTVGPPAGGSPAFHPATPGFHPAQPGYTVPSRRVGPRTIPRDHPLSWATQALASRLRAGPFVLASRRRLPRRRRRLPRRRRPPPLTDSVEAVREEAVVVGELHVAVEDDRQEQVDRHRDRPPAPSTAAISAGCRPPATSSRRPGSRG